MTDNPARPPEAELLHQSRMRMRLSLRDAAERASRIMPTGTGKRQGVSEGRLRQIEAGYQTVSKGVSVPTSAGTDTLAYLAKFYGITPEELESAVRPDAAKLLREILRNEEGRANIPATLRPDVMHVGDGPEEDFLASVLAMLSPKDQEVVRGILRLTDGEGRPWSWDRKRELIESYAARAGERRPAAGLRSAFSMLLLRVF